MLEARDLQWEVHARRVVHGASLALARGECVGLIGPNGSGKSTLLRMLYRVLRPTHGCVQLQGQDVAGMGARAFARQVAVLAQESAPHFDTTVAELVMLGRIPHQADWARDSAQDHAAVRDALQQVGALALADRTLADLSGGEKQRVLVARALAQQPQVLLLDEPTNHLDIRYQLEVMGLLRRQRLSAIVALHDLNIAAHYCDRLVLMDQGRIVAEGEPGTVLTPATLQAVYGVATEVDTHPATGRVRISFIPQALDDA
ncbi:ABC transporter ATP-binding protein [Comamonas phosphati]|nr:ABC transporter ATP-binding protein [Comamonas phosphati]